MDPRRFDHLARSLGSEGSRRTFLGTLAIILGSVFGVRSQASDAAARNCLPGLFLCKTNADCCSNSCKPTTVRTIFGKRTIKTCEVCRPESKATTCTGQCGWVENNCGFRVYCGQCCKPEKKSKTCRNTCGQVTNNCGEVVDCGACPCTPDDPSVTCAGWCGTVLNNCGDPVDCGKCVGESCTAGDTCSGGECLHDQCCADEDVCAADGFCCPSDRGERDVCCPGTGQCCECFQDNSPSSGGFHHYCGCPSSRELCGTYPNDECCLPQDTCVDGACVAKPLACPASDNPGGPNVYCATGCCGQVCCPWGWVCDGTQTCVQSYATCHSTEDCVNSFCVGAELGGEGYCCPGSLTYYTPGPNDENGNVIQMGQCCSPGTEARGCPDSFCTPVSYDLCTATFRGSQPRITG